MTLHGVEQPAGQTLTIQTETLCAGVGSGELLLLDEPLSFWGGTDLATGVITDVHHPQRGLGLAGRVVAMTASRGSSSSSSVLAEQLRAGVGPAALILTERDAILALGALAAAELYGIAMPIVLIGSSGFDVLRSCLALRLDHGNHVRATAAVRAEADRATIEVLPT